MQKGFREAVEANPIIAAVKDEDGLKNCCENEEIGVVFLLFGDICSIGGLVERVHRAGKIAMVHMDLIGGLSPKEVSVDYGARGRDPHDKERDDPEGERTSAFHRAAGFCH